MTLRAGRGYAQGMAGYSWVRGPFATAELGAHVAPGVSVFTKGQWDKAEPWAGIGARLDW